MELGSPTQGCCIPRWQAACDSRRPPNSNTHSINNRLGHLLTQLVLQTLQVTDGRNGVALEVQESRSLAGHRATVDTGRFVS